MQLADGAGADGRTRRFSSSLGLPEISPNESAASARSGAGRSGADGAAIGLARDRRATGDLDAPLFSRGAHPWNRATPSGYSSRKWLQFQNLIPQNLCRKRVRVFSPSGPNSRNCTPFSLVIRLRARIVRRVIVPGTSSPAQMLGVLEADGKFSFIRVAGERPPRGGQAEHAI